MCRVAIIDYLFQTSPSAIIRGYLPLSSPFDCSLAEDQGPTTDRGNKEVNNCNVSYEY